jgi:chromosome segregation ATPase
MDNDKLQEILTSLQISFGRIESTLKNIETKLADYEEIKTKVAVLEEKMEERNKKIESMEENQRWLWRTVAGTVFGAVIVLIFKYISFKG